MASSLSASVSSLQSSLNLVDSSIGILDSGVSDFPRLCKVLHTTRHFELLPEPTLREAQQALGDEIAPSVAHLLSVASNYVDKLARREETLKAKSELQQGRLASERRPSSSHSNHEANKIRGPRATSGTGGGGGQKAFELRRMRQKKERLQYTVERLELQSKQKQRELRKSMAVQ